MTALAMMIGMVPMALGIGEGAEQNAPLGRAVIGGLLIATVATLFFVPVMFSCVRRKGYHRLATEENRARAGAAWALRPGFRLTGPDWRARQDAQCDCR